MTEDLVAAVDRLSAAFAARDADAALECFVADADITYVGSEAEEIAHGRNEVVALFEELFSRPEAYSWRISSAWARQRGSAAYLRVEVIGAVQTDAGDRLEYPYLLSGLLEAEDGTWRWRMCRGSEPAS